MAQVGSLATVDQPKGGIAQVARAQHSETAKREPVSRVPVTDTTPGEASSDDVESQRAPRPEHRAGSHSESVPDHEVTAQPMSHLTEPRVASGETGRFGPSSKPSGGCADVPYEAVAFVAAGTDVRHERSLLDEDPRHASRLLREQAVDIVLEEGPISEERLLSVLGKRFDLQRLKGSRKEQLRASLPKELGQRNELGEVFYWPNADPATYTEFRERGDREGTDIPLEELVNAMQSALSQATHLEKEELFHETRKTFDIGRLGSRIKPRFDRAHEILRAKRDPENLE